MPANPPKADPTTARNRSQSPNPRPHLHTPSALLLIVLALALVACSSASRPADEDRERRETGRALFGETETRAPRADAWSIVLLAFRGERHQQAAAEALERVRTQGGLPDAYIQQRAPTVSAVAFGRYPAPEDPAAQRDLRRLRAITIDNAQPFAAAFLAPPVLGAEQGQLRELDLRNARAIHGSSVLYTLQIGAYDPGPNAPAADLREARRLAEQAAAQLRREGELAFFYHGPNRSMVTVGVYTTDDHGSFGESAELQRARTQFPHNLVNGQGVRVGGGLQPSFLVAIP